MSEALKLVEKFNNEVDSGLWLDGYTLTYGSNGFEESISFGDYILWNSENSDSEIPLRILLNVGINTLIKNLNTAKNVINLED